LTLCLAWDWTFTQHLPHGLVTSSGLCLRPVALPSSLLIARARWKIGPFVVFDVLCHFICSWRNFNGSMHKLFIIKVGVNLLTFLIARSLAFVVNWLKLWWEGLSRPALTVVNPRDSCSGANLCTSRLAFSCVWATPRVWFGRTLHAPWSITRTRLIFPVFWLGVVDILQTLVRDGMLVSRLIGFTSWFWFLGLWHFDNLFPVTERFPLLVQFGSFLRLWFVSLLSVLKLTSRGCWELSGVNSL